MTVPHQPADLHTVTSYLIVDDAAAALDFYARAFGATETLRLAMGDRVGHAEVRIGDSAIMLSGEWPEMGALGPKTRGGATSSLNVYVPDADAAFARAIDAGATVERPVENQFYGDRAGTVVDPFGHKWTLATHVEDVPEDEIKRRFAAMMSEMAG